MSSDEQFPLPRPGVNAKLKLASITTVLPAGGDLLTAEAVARLLHVHAAALRRMVEAGVFPRPVRLGRGLVRWNAATLRDWLDGNTLWDWLDVMGLAGATHVGG